MPGTENLAIIPLTDPDDLQSCEVIEREVWRFDLPDLVTASMLATCGRHGGMILGARVEGRLIGFVFAFPAFHQGHPIIHSHMLAVIQEFRDHGVGRLLKEAQKRNAINRGIDLITWTYDPLEAKNAHLNLNKLGVILRHYYVNLYGESTSSNLHQGLGTDRFLAEWYLRDPVSQLDEKEWDAPNVIQTLTGADGLPGPGEADLSHSETRLLVEVPAQIQLLKQRDPALAMQWRLQTRRAFTYYMARGYCIRHLLVRKASRIEEFKTYYCLQDEN